MEICVLRVNGAGTADKTVGTVNTVMMEVLCYFSAAYKSRDKLQSSAHFKTNRRLHRGRKDERERGGFGGCTANTEAASPFSLSQSCSFTPALCPEQLSLSGSVQTCCSS